MRALAIYLALYFALIAGAVVALWTGGVLAHLPAWGVAAALVLAVGAGLLAVVVWRWQPGRSAD